MKLENGPLNVLVALFVVAVISTSVVVPALAINFGQSPAGADYVVFEGVAGNDFYDKMQYSYKINQWFSESGQVCSGSKTGFEYNPGNAYFNAGKSLRIGYTEYGEIATPVYAGLAYGANAAEFANTESWASSNINPAYWIQGWVFYMNYRRQTVNRTIEAWALYSDLSTNENGRKVYSWFGNHQPNTPSAMLTEGRLETSGVKVLYDSARLCIGRTETTIIDGYYGNATNPEKVAKVVLTVVYNKDTKYAIVYKDVKILLDPKILDWITDFAFSERYELDLARGINPNNEAYIHYYGYDSAS
ncbi:MAG: hypothetical protein QFX35_05900, partial [Candidatus Verstraetearchaeota archaeon]|nr:hypothetical protein [Candidatus Verstraetearchaeota archaeon]